MATNNNWKTFVVKKVKPGRKETDKPFYLEVGRLVIRGTEKGVSETLYLHHLDGDFAVFPRAGYLLHPRAGQAATLTRLRHGVRQVLELTDVLPKAPFYAPTGREPRHGCVKAIAGSLVGYLVHRRERG